MGRLIIIILLFLLSLLCVFRAPEYHLWYVSILATEFCWVFLPIVVLLLLWGFKQPRFGLAGTLLGLVAFILFLIPIIGAYRAGSKLSADMDTAFGHKGNTAAPSNVFSLVRTVTGIGAAIVPDMTIAYSKSSDGPLTLDFYKANLPGARPCVIVVHGGSWSAGTSRQLPELNSRLAMAGYNVASINYRLAPKYISPAPVEDVHAAVAYLKAHAADLAIDTADFVLLGRSAGGQIVLTAGYTLHDPSIKGIVNFYGPADMVWGYAHPANPLVLNTCKVMEDYLGGTYAQVPQSYVASSGTAVVNASSVPTLTIHGMNDPLVDYEHATRLEDKLQAAGVKHYLLSLPWATHGCDYSLNGPSGQLSTYAVLRFLDAVTGKGDSK